MEYVKVFPENPTESDLLDLPIHSVVTLESNSGYSIRMIKVHKGIIYEFCDYDNGAVSVSTVFVPLIKDYAVYHLINELRRLGNNL